MKTLLLVFSCAALALAGSPGAIAIRNARIVPVSGPPIEKGTVIVRDGLIEAVGAAVATPPDAWIIEGDGLSVYPGMVDAKSTLGIEPAVPTTGTTFGRTSRTTTTTTTTPATPTTTTTAAPSTPVVHGPWERPSTTSWQRAADLIATSDRRIEAARSAGITTAVTFPTRGIFAGQGDVIDLAGDRPGQMVVAGPVGQHVSLASAGFSTFPGSLLGVIAYIRQVYIDCDYYQKAKAMYGQNPKGMTRPEYDRALEGLLASPRILLPATRAVEIERMLRLGADLKQKFVLYGMHGAYRAADQLKAAGVPVLVSLKWPERSADRDPDDVEQMRALELRENAPTTPAALAKAGIKFAFYTDGNESRGALVRAVKKAVDAGLSNEAALRALTLSPAEIYGVADRLGSIEAGKIANLVVTKGDLLDASGKIEMVFVDGNKYLPAAETSAPEGFSGRQRPAESEEIQ